MFERFTDKARSATVLAQEEARLTNSATIETGHLLLGVWGAEGNARHVLKEIGFDADAFRETLKKSDTPVLGHLPFTPRAKKILELSLREALALGHNYIGTEHILLGLIREGDGTAAQALATIAPLDVVKAAVIATLTGSTTVLPPSSLTPCVCVHVEAHHHHANTAGFPIIDQSNRSCRWNDCGCPTFVAAS